MSEKFNRIIKRQRKNFTKSRKEYEQIENQYL